MAKQPPEYPVMIPYSELCELLDASKQVKEYKSEVKRLESQVLALRVIQQQCIEKIRELEKLL